MADYENYMSILIEPNNNFDVDGLIIHNTTNSAFHMFVKQIDPIVIDVVNDIVKENSEKYKPTIMKKVRRAYTKSKEVEKLFGLNEDDIENIFDMIKQEHKDL